MRFALLTIRPCKRPCLATIRSVPRPQKWWQRKNAGNALNTLWNVLNGRGSLMSIGSTAPNNTKVHRRSTMMTIPRRGGSFLLQMKPLTPSLRCADYCKPLSQQGNWLAHRTPFFGLAPIQWTDIRLNSSGGMDLPGRVIHRAAAGPSQARGERLCG